MIIAIFANEVKTKARGLAIGIREYLSSKDVQVIVPDETVESIGGSPLSSIDPKTIDYAISMGGDGTILRLVHNYPEVEAPIMGINLGHLGFMADVPISEIYPSLIDLLGGAFTVQERLMMDGETLQGEKCIAVNEMAVHRARNPSLIGLALHVDGVFLNTFEADGIIVATPSGSTAYSLAAGGPILSPELNGLVITPISPHTVSNRPFVLMPKEEIQIQYLSEADPVEITFDGISRFNLCTGEVFRIRPSKKVFRLVTLHRHDYFSTLRTKLGWAGTLRK